MRKKKGKTTRKLDAPRYPNGQIKKERIAVNSKVLELRMLLAKDIRADQTDPLSILFHRGMLSTDVQDAQNRYDTGRELAELYRRVNGSPHARSGGIGGKEHPDPVSALMDETRFKQAIRALDRCGRNTRRIVLDCCVHLKMPALDHVMRLRDGLDAVYELPRPSLSQASRDRATAEMAA